MVIVRQWSRMLEFNPIPKTQKMVLDTSLFNTLHYKVRKSRVNGAIQGKEFGPPLHHSVVAICVTLDYGRYIYIYIYIYTCTLLHFGTNIII